MLSFSPLGQHLVSLFVKHYYKIESSKTVAMITHVWMGHISTTTGSNHMIRSLFGSQEGILSPIPPVLSATHPPPSHHKTPAYCSSFWAHYMSQFWVLECVPTIIQQVGLIWWLQQVHLPWLKWSLISCSLEVHAYPDFTTINWPILKNIYNKLSRIRKAIYIITTMYEPTRKKKVQALILLQLSLDFVSILFIS